MVKKISSVPWQIKVLFSKRETDRERSTFWSVAWQNERNGKDGEEMVSGLWRERQVAKKKWFMGHLLQSPYVKLAG